MVVLSEAWLRAGLQAAWARDLRQIRFMAGLLPVLSKYLLGQSLHFSELFLGHFHRWRTLTCMLVTADSSSLGISLELNKLQIFRLRSAILALVASVVLNRGVIFFVSLDEMLQGRPKALHFPFDVCFASRGWRRTLI
jgi:hypothetical protein